MFSDRRGIEKILNIIEETRQKKASTFKEKVDALSVKQVSIWGKSEISPKNAIEMEQNVNTE
jgi:hypothetical protein